MVRKSALVEVDWNMVVVNAFGSRFTLRVVNGQTGLAKEEFVNQKDGQAFIAADVNEAFKVTLSRESDKWRLEYPRVKCSLYVDGRAVSSWNCVSAAAKASYTFQGFWKDGTGNRFWEFRFGEPGEGAKRSADPSHLEIKLSIWEVMPVGLVGPRRQYANTPPDTARSRMKKFYMPHVEAGASFDVDSKLVPLSTTKYAKVGLPVDMSIRYTTTEGLRILDIVPGRQKTAAKDEKKTTTESPSSTVKRERKPRIDEAGSLAPKPEPAPPRKKPKQESGSSQDTAIDLTDGVTTT